LNEDWKGGWSEMMSRTRAGIAAALISDEGATATEYAIMVSFVALVIILAVTALGGRLSALFTTASTAF